MAINDYIIKFSSSSDSSTPGYFYKPPFTVSERSTNKTATSLSLFGKYNISYGEDLQTNLVRLLENFSRNVPPSNPTVGQLWFDTGTRLLKVYTPSSTGNVWSAVGSGGSGSTSLTLATDSTAGVIKTGGAFTVPASGALTMRNVSYSAAVVTPPSPARYTIDANLSMTGHIYSYDDYNYIAPSPTVPESTFNKYFITKKYADERYAGLASSGGSGGTGGSLPVWFPSSAPTKGVFAYDGSNTIWSKSNAADRVLTCVDSLGTLSWEQNISSPSWVPSATPTKGVLTYNGTSTNWSKGSINQVLTCTDGTGTVGWTTVTGSGVLPIATSLVLGGIRPQHPFIVNALGDISLEDVTYRVFVPATGATPSISAQYDFEADLKTSGDAYSATPDNNIGLDITRPVTDYDSYFVTKKYADDHYAALGTGGSGGSGTLVIATSTVLGGIKVGTPFTTNATTGELSLAGIAYNPSKVEYAFNSNILMQKSIYSADQDGLVDADNGKPSTYYDSYYITKHYAESKYAKLGASGGSAGGSYILPTASTIAMGGVKIGDPLSISATGVLSLAKIAYDSAKSEYTFTAAINSGDALYSTDVRNKIDLDTTKPANFYDGYFITKSYADTRYAAIGAAGGTGTGGSTSATIATSSALGSIMIAKPFAVDGTGVLQLQKVSFTSDVAANPSATPPVVAAPAEYVFDAAIKSMKWLYSDDENNTIGLDVAKNYDKYFITKKYADTHFATIGSTGGGGTVTPNPYTLPAANNTDLGGIKVGAPFDMSATGVLSLPLITFNVAVTANPGSTTPVAAKPAEYIISAAVGINEFLWSDHIDNKIFSEPGKPASDYDKYFITKHFADTNYLKSTTAYSLPVSTSTELGGVKVSAPLNVDANGVLTLPLITLDNANDRYDFDVNVQVKKHILSSDNDNNINKEAGKSPADYDNYFVTKHFADTHYASIGSTGGTGGTPVGFTVVEPLLLTGTAVSLRDLTYDGPHNEYRISTNLKTLGKAYSSDLDNNIGATGVPVADFDYYYTTKHYVDANYLRLGTTFDNTSTAKSKFVLEYATGFVLSDLNGKDTALVTKKYVDDKSVGPTTVSTFADNSVIFSSANALSEDSKLKYDKATSTLKTSKIVLESITSSTESALTIYNPTASATSGASIQLFSSPLPETPASTKPTNPSGTLLGTVKFGGWDGATEYGSSSIEAYSTEDWSATAHGSRLVISSTKTGAKDSIPALIVQGDNSVVIPGGLVENIYNTNSTTWTLDPTQGSMQILTTTANVTITLPAASAFTGKSVSVVVKYSGAHSITWSGAISWESNVVPVPTSLAGTTDIFSFFGDGTKIYGVCSGQAFP